jgi:uncharacterized lipoprotein NlpE involved in copper resistance
MKKSFLVLIIIVALSLFGCTNNETDGITAESDFNSNIVDLNLPVNEDNGSNNLFGEMIKGVPNHYVNYDMTSAQGKVELKQWIKGDKLRQDTTFEEVSTKTFFVENKVTICTNAAGQEMCFEQTSTDPISTGIDTAKQNISSWEDKMTALPSKTIAGVNTTCYKIVDADATYSYCFSKEAVPLFVETIVGEETITMVAKEYNTSVDDSVFVPPQAQQMPNFPTQ